MKSEREIALSINPRLVSRSIDAKNAVTIATPPPRGVGDTCELRTFGTSIKFFRRAYPRINPVVITAMANAVITAKTTFDVMGGDPRTNTK
jgi:hypothetical protein